MAQVRTLKPQDFDNMDAHAPHYLLNRTHLIGGHLLTLAGYDDGYALIHATSTGLRYGYHFESQIEAFDQLDATSSALRTMIEKGRMIK